MGEYAVVKNVDGATVSFPQCLEIYVGRPLYRDVQYVFASECISVTHTIVIHGLWMLSVSNVREFILCLVFFLSTHLCDSFLYNH